jgi:hypothetical protein
MNVYLENICFNRSVALSGKEDLWNELNDKYKDELEDEWICEEKEGMLLFFPQFEEEEFGDYEEFEVPYDLINEYGVGEEVTNYHFYSFSKGTNWTMEKDPRPDEFYHLLQQIFGDYWFGLVLVDDEDETRLIINVTDSGINAEENN